MSPATTTNALFFTDVHIPFEDKKSIAAIERYLKEKKFDRIICGGDLCDFDFISSHNKTNLRSNAGKSIKKQYDAVNRFLDRWQNLQPDAEWTLIEGNHDFRIQRYLDEHPESEGMLEVPAGLHLEERGIEWIPFWQDKSQKKTVGKATFIHGLYCNDFHAKKHGQSYETNIFYGHLHDFQQHSLVTLGSNSTRMAQSCGCLCDYKQAYMYGRPSRWQQGFVEFVFRPDGYFQYFPVMIFNHRFVSPGGEMYKP